MEAKVRSAAHESVAGVLASPEEVLVPEMTANRVGIRAALLTQCPNDARTRDHVPTVATRE